MTKISDWMDVEKIQALHCSNIEGRDFGANRVVLAEGVMIVVFPQGTR